jgi:GT2 family glycosyltransferase
MESLKQGVSVIIVTYNSGHFLASCLASLESALANLAHEVIVVDNASRVRPQAQWGHRFSNVIWIENEENVGFGKACNRGASLVKYSNILLVNPDTLFPEKSIEYLLQALESRSEIGVIGCKILFPDGTIQRAGRRRFPTPVSALAHLVGAEQRMKTHAHQSYSMVDYFDESPIEVDAISGSLMCIPTAIYREINGFDEDFFLYGEDLDICLRIQAAGYKVWYDPSVHVIHVKGHSSVRRPWFTHYHFYLAMCVFAKKHRARIGVFPWIIQFGVICVGLFIALRRLIPARASLMQLGGSILLSSLTMILLNGPWLDLGLLGSVTLGWFVLQLIPRFWSSLGWSAALSSMSLWIFQLNPLFLIPMFLGALIGWSMDELFRLKKEIRNRKRVMIWSNEPCEQLPISDQVDVLVRLKGVVDLELWLQNPQWNEIRVDEIWVITDRMDPETQSVIVKLLESGSNCKLAVWDPSGTPTFVELHLVWTNIA